MKRTSTLIVLLVTIAFTSSAKAAIVYEGYYKVMQGPKQFGYTIDRREKMDSNSNHKLTRYTALPSGDAQIETFEVDPSFRAVNYTFATSKGGTVMDQVQASFSGGWVTMTSTASGKPAKDTQKFQIPSDTTFDPFLGDYLKSMKRGQFVPGTKLNVVRFVDEPGISVSEVTVGPSSMIGGRKTYQLDVRPRDVASALTYFVTDAGQLVQGRGMGFGVLLVSSLREAAGTIATNTAEIQRVFGGMPKGSPVMAAEPAKPVTVPPKKK